jgi:hypothetical protein
VHVFVMAHRASGADTVIRILSIPAPSSMTSTYDTAPRAGYQVNDGVSERIAPMGDTGIGAVTRGALGPASLVARCPRPGRPIAIIAGDIPHELGSRDEDAVRDR